MEYRCIDRGSGRCPCRLIEEGHCISCTMVSKGRCSCGIDWSGTCPYTEHMQGQEGSFYSLECGADKVREYPSGLTVVRVKVPLGIVLRGREAGAFMMAESLGYKVPLSLLTAYSRYSAAPSHYSAAPYPEGERGYGFIEFALQPAGPKTKALLKEKKWKISGPFYSGLLGPALLEPAGPAVRSEDESRTKILVLGRGTALAPYILIKDRFRKWIDGRMELIADVDKTDKEFLEDYLSEEAPERMDFTDEKVMAILKEKVKTAVKSKDGIIWVLTSPYYFERLTEGLGEEEKERIVRPNHSNMCCGEGICGSCSFTDRDGVTVKTCKCRKKW